MRTGGGTGGRPDEVERVLGLLGKLEKLETGECPLTDPSCVSHVTYP